VDDTKLLISFKFNNIESYTAKKNQDLLNIRNRCLNNQLLLNPVKTKFVVFGSRQMTAKIKHVSVSLMGKELKPVKIKTL
jgi:hypothetical protein